MVTFDFNERNCCFPSPSGADHGGDASGIGEEFVR
jgi:hypothetical protein